MTNVARSVSVTSGREGILRPGTELSFGNNIRPTLIELGRYDVWEKY